MKRMLLSGLVVGAMVFAASAAYAQNAFWTFDEQNREAVIPPQCDGQFDEARGGVFLPSPDDLFEQGELFLMEKGEKRLGAGYCLMAAAVQGHTEAQYRLAQLYNKGIVLPQNDLVAYKWAFIASLNGHEAASRLALLLEQFLTTEEIRAATDPVKSMLPQMLQKKQETLDEQTRIVEEKQIELERINSEIDAILGINFKSDVIPGRKQLLEENDFGGTQAAQAVLPSQNDIFSDADRMK
ncbi:MAG: hypothetical protein ACI4QM_03755 [Alphaproteobacteria bacterium]